MNKLTKTQQEHLTALAIGVVMVCGILYYLGVMSRQDELAAVKKKAAVLQGQLSDAEKKIRTSDTVVSSLTNRSEILGRREAGLVQDRDAYAWLINTMNGFVQSRRGISIDSYSQPEISEAGVVPGFPYHWATFHLKGTGYYQDIGKFMADFENAFPYFRIQNPALSANIGAGVEPEKLSFTFDIVAPVVASSDSK